MKRKEMVHVPNWFTVDAKTGVKHLSCPSHTIFPLFTPPPFSAILPSGLLTDGIHEKPNF